MLRYTYAVFIPVNRWVRTNNKRQALKFARTHKGYVRRMPYALGTDLWDAPTFRVCSELLADFRADQSKPLI